MSDRYHYSRLQEYDLRKHLVQQIQFSTATFGPSDRANGILDHIEKEVAEVREDPTDLEEWIDLLILACDGAWRCAVNNSKATGAEALPGRAADIVISALCEKMKKNERRKWPDWREVDEGKAIEHIRGEHD